MLLKRILRSFVTRQEIEKKLTEMIQKYVPGELQMKKKYSEQGLTDMDTLEIIASIENQFSADLDPNDVMLLENPEDTVDLLYKNITDPSSKKVRDPSKLV